MILFDFMILNGDRNASNAMLVAPPDGGEGMVLPIDHGFAFDKDPFENLNGTEATFEWFMNYQLTKAWLDYVLGGLALNDNVSEATLRSVVEDFLDVYGHVDGGDISARFQSIPGVTAEQIEYVETWVGDMVDRIDWMRDNMDTILDALIGAGTP
jgi:hypothetical protein